MIANGFLVVAWLIASFFHKGNEFDESEIDADDEAEENRHSAKNRYEKLKDADIIME